MMQKSINNILVPVNFSHSANDAIETGIAMSKRHKAILHLLEVDRESVLPYPTGKNALLIDLRLEARQARQLALEKTARSISEQHNITCYYHISEGTFAQTVSAVANDFYCDIILLQRPVSSGLGRLFHTNSAYEIISHATCPVLVIPGKCIKTRFESVLFPVWPAQSVIEKLESSLEIIRRNNARVTLYGSTNSGNSVSECQLVSNLSNTLHSIISLSNTSVEQEMDPTPRTAKKIIKKALEKGSDLIVISASITKGLKRLFTQSYTEKMINESPIPVLSVK